MSDLTVLDSRFQDFVRDLPELLPDGMTEIDLEELHRLGLLKTSDEESSGGSSITRYFHVVEADDKITLYNKTFVAWIVPQMVERRATTFTFIAVRTEDDDLSLEMVFSSRGVYNSSRLVLRILERYLEEIQETTQFLANLSSEQ